MEIDLNTCGLIVIEAVDTDSGIEAEYGYLNRRFGPYGSAWDLLSQKVTTVFNEDWAEGVHVDIFTIQLEDAQIKTIVFDISSFYGKHDFME